MEKLFTDTLGIQKERPTTITAQQLEKIYLDLAQEIKDNNYSSSSIEIITDDLKKLFITDSGYEKAKALEENGRGTYNFDGGFIDELDFIYPQIDTVLQENIKLWVKAHDIKPKLTKGSKLLIKESLNREQAKGEFIYINGIKEDTGNYVIDKNPNRNGGSIISFERIEVNCEILND